MYNNGPYELRLRRLAKMKELGLIDDEIVPHDVVNPSLPDWEELSDHQRALSSRAFAAYAGMVERMDQNIQRVIEHLKRTGEYDNTFSTCGGAPMLHEVLTPFASLVLLGQWRRGCCVSTASHAACTKPRADAARRYEALRASCHTLTHTIY